MTRDRLSAVCHSDPGQQKTPDRSGFRTPQRQKHSLCGGVAGLLLKQFSLLLDALGEFFLKLLVLLLNHLGIDCRNVESGRKAVERSWNETT